MTAAKEGDTVKIHYKGTFEDGEVFDTSEGKDPLQFKIGEHQVVPGFENAVIGMKKGAKKSVTIKPKEAYGEPRAELVQEVPLEHVKQAGIEPKEGMVLGIQHPQMPGKQLPAKVVSIGKETVKLDLNHPLAGKTLKFDIELVE
ncbi:peptidylprolyl isomerase [Candidatus Woesearchaeota archaeon]|nr:peptidylprolyl isomerase [Candidatus Woesearchaeota archaeon]